MTTKYKMLPKFLLGAALIVAPQLVHAAPGDLDTTFDTDGKRTVGWYTEGHGRAVAVQSDNKIVVVGRRSSAENGSDFAISRINTDGTLDSTFNASSTTPGKASVDFGGGDDSPLDVAIDGDGKIVVIGTTADTTLNDEQVAVARLNSNGTLDTTFSGDGMQVIVNSSIDPITENAYARSVALQGDGKIVLGGSMEKVSYPPLGGVQITRHPLGLRLNSNGTLDTSFGGDGIIHSGDFSQTVNAFIHDVVIQPDGKIFFVGNTSTTNIIVTHAFVNRMSSSGVLDTTFTAGLLGDDVGQTRLYAAALQGDGKLVAVGTTQFSSVGNEFIVVRYNTNGTLDTSFSVDGYRTVGFAAGTTDDTAHGVFVQPANGRIVIAGFAETSSPSYVSNFAMTRLNTNGDIDTTFTSDATGKVLTDFGADDECTSMARTSDGKIVLAGRTYATGNIAFAVARYLGSSGSSGSLTTKPSAKSF